MYDWVRALLDPTDIVQSPSSAKKHITPPPKFELPSDEPAPSSQNGRSRRSASPSKKSTSPRKSRAGRPTKDVLATPSTTAANNTLQEALDRTTNQEADGTSQVLSTVEETEVKVSASPEKKTKGRKSKKAAAEAEEDKAEEKKEEKKAEKKKKKETKEKETEAEAAAADDADTAQTRNTVSLEMPISLPQVPSAAETEEMISKAKEMVEDAIKTQSTQGTAAKVTKKRKPVEEDDEETAAEAAQRTKKARVLEDKLKRERVRNRALFGVSAAFALA